MLYVKRPRVGSALRTKGDFMRSWFWTLLVLAAAVGLALGVRYHAGNVAILLPPYRVELSTSLAVLLLVVLFALLYFGLRTMSWTLSIPSRMRHWRSRRYQGHQQAKLEQGWVHLLEGRYSRAETDLSEIASEAGSDSRRVLSSLSAARAAHALGEYERRDAMLARAHEAAVRQDNLLPAVKIAHADMLLEQLRAVEALEQLQSLHAQGARHIHTQKLLLRAHRLLQDWPAVLKLTRSLTKHSALDVAEGERLTADAVKGLMREAPDAAAKKKLWKQLKDFERAIPDVALEAAQAMREVGDYESARQLLETALNRGKRVELLNEYGRCDPAFIQPRLVVAERWLASSPNDPDLLELLGMLCLGKQLWGQAERHLEDSLKYADEPRVHALLAVLYDRTGKLDQAVHHWRLASQDLVPEAGLMALPDTDRTLPIALPPGGADTDEPPVRAAGL